MHALHPNSILEKIFYPQYKKNILKNLARFLPEKGKVLDVGCDDGRVGKRLMQKIPGLKFYGIDIQDNRKSLIPRKIYNGKKIPYPDNSFDSVITVDVLHHTTYIPTLLKEMKRVSKNTIIIKDQASDGFLSYCLISAGDWITNVFQGIKCAFNYPTIAGWKQMFKKQKLAVVKLEKMHEAHSYNYFFKLKI